MAINVNVISENNAFNVENVNYCTVALPITACWGPGFSLSTADPTNTSGEVNPIEVALENTAWSLFPAGPDGLESFIATYRGPSSNYRSTKDYSYFMALSLLNSGYAVQTCRLCPGTKAQTTIPEEGGSGSGNDESATGSLVITAKYPGTFGNNLKVSLKKKGNSTFTYWNLIGYAVDANGNSRAVENLVFVFKPEDSTDTIVSIDELQSKFFDFKVVGEIAEDQMETEHQTLQGGADVANASDQDAAAIMDDAIKLAGYRYNEGADYLKALQSAKDHIGNNKSAAEAIRFNEWIYTYTIGIPGSTADNGIIQYQIWKSRLCTLSLWKLLMQVDVQRLILMFRDHYPVAEFGMIVKKKMAHLMDMHRSYLMWQKLIMIHFTPLMQHSLLLGDSMYTPVHQGRHRLLRHSWHFLSTEL